MDATTKPFDVNEIETGIEDIVQNAKESKNLYDQFRPRTGDSGSIRREIGRVHSGSPPSRFEDVAAVVQAEDDLVNHPAHYNTHPSGVECITITEHMNFCRGNAVKYIWRADEKGDPIENLKKARWYLDREIERLERQL